MMQSLLRLLGAMSLISELCPAAGLWGSPRSKPSTGAGCAWAICVDPGGSSGACGRKVHWFL